MTPCAYINEFKYRKRMAERRRLATLVGVSLHAVRAWTSEVTVTGPDGVQTTCARRRVQDPAVAVKLEKATRGMVTVAEWNPRFAPLVK